jgi:hypothetical protein
MRPQIKPLDFKRKKSRWSKPLASLGLCSSLSAPLIRGTQRNTQSAAGCEMSLARRSLLAIGLIILGFGAICASSFAQAACYSPRETLPSQTIDQFTSDPASLLTQFPNGGAQMIARVRDLAASNPATLNALISLLATATADQQKAIGTGLGQAALVCVKTDQPYATQIQQAVTASGNGDAIGALTAILGDQPIGAAGVGGGGLGGGGVGSITPFNGGGGGGGAPTIFGGFTSSPRASYFTSPFFGASTPGTTTTTTTVITQQVSPH